MSPQDKLALGMSLFVIFFVIAFMVFPARRLSRLLRSSEAT